MKQNKFRRTLLLTTAVCLLPMLLSAALYSQLPDQIPIHWNAAGQPDNYAPKLFAAFGLPALMAVFNLLVHLLFQADPKRANMGHMLRLLALWCCPVLCVILMPVTLFSALGVPLSIPVIVSAVVGVLFILIGNYLPKSGQSYTMGVRLPWTLDDPDNWRKTARLSGYLFIFAGALIFLCGCLQLFWPALVALLLAVIVPAVYSYLLYRRAHPGGQ